MPSLKNRLIMEKSLLPYQTLINEAVAYLNKIGYAHRSLDRFYQEWVEIGQYMAAHNIERYTPEVGSLYLNNSTGHLEYDSLNQSQRNQIRNVSVLSDYVSTGTVRRHKRRYKVNHLTGEIGVSMLEWIAEYQRNHIVKPDTTRAYYSYISVFMTFLHEHDIHVINDINTKSLVDFTNSLSAYSHSSKREIISKVNKYLYYLYENKLTRQNYSLVINKPLYVRNPKLPVYYSKEDVEQIVNSINRATPEGKRDYAIILLAARLGLRCSDIWNLNFSNINWDKSIISLCQVKTTQMVELPLLPDVGNAIIDYLRCGRPVSDSNAIFIRHTSPYDRMTTNHLYSISKYHITNSGIKYDERKYGLHTFRHSLATNLLESNVPMTTISGVLGHTSSVSTRNYLRVDIESLRKCALELPIIRKEVVL